MHEEVVRMSVAGWLFMGISWFLITSLAVFCVRKVLMSGGSKDPEETPLD